MTKTVVHAVPVVLYICRPIEDYPITFISDKLREQMSIHPSRVMGRSGLWREYAHPDDLPAMDAAFPALRDTGRYSVEFRLRRADNDYIWVQNELRLVCDPAGQPLEVVGYLLDIHFRKQTERALRNLAGHLQTIREEERTGIARELHDELGQTLTALKIDVVRLRSRISNPDRATFDLFDSITSFINRMIETTQSVVAMLRPMLLDQFGLIPAIEWYAEQFSKRTAIRCALKLTPGGVDLSSQASTALFRILQESLNNVARHARASEVGITLDQRDGWVTLMVKDNGRGLTALDIDSSHSFGLMGMRERAHVFGGEVIIEGQPGKGATVSARIPVPNNMLRPEDAQDSDC
jgi:PAS domain S-box-containing protein